MSTPEDSYIEIACGKVQAQCRCGEPPHKDGPHRCACGGSWHYDPDGYTVMVAYPGSAADWTGPDSRDAVWFDLLLAGPPFRAGRGPIRYVLPPDVADTPEA